RRAEGRPRPRRRPRRRRGRRTRGRHPRRVVRPRPARHTRPHPGQRRRPQGARPRHRRRTRRRDPRRTHPDRHAVRAQPHRRLPLAGRVRHRGRLRGRGTRPRRRTGRTGPHVTATQRTYWLEHAWLGTHVEPGVTLTVQDGRISAVRPDTPAPPPGAEILRGLTLPGLANAHSHAFHRALRSTVQVGSGT